MDKAQEANLWLNANQKKTYQEEQLHKSYGEQWRILLDHYWR